MPCQTFFQKIDDYDLSAEAVPLSQETLVAQSAAYLALPVAKPSCHMLEKTSPLAPPPVKSPEGLAAPFSSPLAKRQSQKATRKHSVCACMCVRATLASTNSIRVSSLIGPGKLYRVWGWSLCLRGLQ